MGATIPDAVEKEGEFERLERAVVSLVDRFRRLSQEHAALRRRGDERERRIRSLEEQLLESNQRRQDVLKRVDDLIAQIEQLESHLTTPDG